MQVKKQQLEPYMEQTDSKLRKKYDKAVYCYRANVENIMWNAGLSES